LRFLLFDRITKLEKGKAAEAIKTFSLAEECYRDHFSNAPIVPGVLFIEAMAQVLGWLINYSHDFKLLSIMSLIEGVRVPCDFRPGVTVRVRAEIISTSSRDSMGRAWVESSSEESIAQLDRIIYTHWRDVDSATIIKWFRYCNGGKDFA
jgi:3-hydroxyacyl-[acyl-carrier-protein] dehydratase